MFWGLILNLLSYEVHKSVYLGLSGVQIQTPKNTAYVLGFDPKPFVVRSTQKRLFGSQVCKYKRPSVN